MYFSELIRVTIAALKLERRLDALLNYHMVGYFPDIVILICETHTKLPVGLVEVKKPSGEAMTGAKIAGQIHDYLVALQAFFGIAQPFGILTTFQETRFCWLEKREPSDPNRSSQSQNQDFTIPEFPPFLSSEDSSENSSKDENLKEEIRERKLFSTKVIKSSEPRKLFDHLSAFLLMVDTLHPIVPGLRKGNLFSVIQSKKVSHLVHSSS